MAAQLAEKEKYRNVILDPDREAKCELLLRDYLSRIGQPSIDKNVEELLSIESGVCDRFNYISPHATESRRLRLLVSGCAVGSEMIIGRKYGFQEIAGTEVVSEYAEIARQRLRGRDGFKVILYDGWKLPFVNDCFTTVTSGHVIEHTRSPYHYLKEHMRVLAPGGVMFLEFPNRYHPVELHTGVISLEYLPRPLRALGLHFCASPVSALPLHRRQQYDLIRRTLQPVSVWQIKLFLLRIGEKAKVVHHYSPAPGVTRMIITKLDNLRES